jgi:quercetin dioxygenase-like cupin family protein
MTQPRWIAASLVVGVLAAAWGVGQLKAQAPGFKRVELQRQELSVPGREAVVGRGDFLPGGAIGKHTHPGEELAYVLEGQVVMEVEGKEPVTLKAGEVFFIPAGVVHAAKNAGKVPARILATYFVEKGKPLATLQK